MTEHEVKNDVPPVYVREEDTRKFLQILDHGLSNVRADILSLLDAVNYEKAEEKWLDLMLVEAGWTLGFALTVNQKRKAVKRFVLFYSRRGIDQTMVDFVQEFLGFAITIDRPVDDVAILEVRWRIPFHRLMGTTGLLSFTVHAPSGISAGDEAALTESVDLLRWGVEEWKLVKDL
jgi:phage tail-like protein